MSHVFHHLYYNFARATHSRETAEEGYGVLSL